MEKYGSVYTPNNLAHCKSMMKEGNEILITKNQSSFRYTREKIDEIRRNLQNTLSPCRESLMAGMDKSVMDYILANNRNYLKRGKVEACCACIPMESVLKLQ